MGRCYRKVDIEFSGATRDDAEGARAASMDLLCTANGKEGEREREKESVGE